MAQTVKRLSTMWETQVRSLGREDPLEKEMVVHSSTIAWKIPWTEEPGVAKSRTRLSDFTHFTRLVVAFLPMSKCLLISWLQSPSAVILEPRRIKSLTVSIVSPSLGFPCGSAGKESAGNVGDLDSVPGLGRSPGEGKNNLGKTHTKEEVGH